MRQKRRSEVLFTIGFLLTLIIALSTFFMGLRMGIAQTESKYSHLNISKPDLETETSYTQQDLVTFYYVVFEPYQQYKERYLTLIDMLERSDSTTNSRLVLKEIRTTSKEQYEQISATSIAAASPLLKEAHNDVLKSLKLFHDSIDQILEKSSTKSGSQLADDLVQNEFIAKAVSYGLQGQKKYYSSILKWAAKSNEQITGDYQFDNDTTIQQWSKLSLAVKNKAVSDIMASNKLYVSYLPQDMTAKIDQMIDSGKASNLNLKSVTSIVKILTQTEAVQNKEFSKWQRAFYANESLPALPFFIDK